MILDSRRKAAHYRAKSALLIDEFRIGRRFGKPQESQKTFGYPAP